MFIVKGFYNKKKDVHACCDILHFQSHLSRNQAWHTGPAVKGELEAAVEVVARKMAVVEMTMTHADVKCQRQADAVVQGDNW